MNWIVAILAFGLLLIIRKRSKPGWLWVVKALLAAIGGAALAETAVGGWIVALITAVAGFFGGLFGVGAVVVAGVVALVVSVTVVLDIAVDRSADSGAIAGLVALPLLFIVAAGPVADGGSQLVGAIQQLGTGLLAPLIGA